MTITEPIWLQAGWILYSRPGPACTLRLLSAVITSHIWLWPLNTDGFSLNNKSLKSIDRNRSHKFVDTSTSWKLRYIDSIDTPEKRLPEGRAAKRSLAYP